MAGPNIQVDDHGNLWDTSSGTPRFVGRAPGTGSPIQSPFAAPTLPYEGPQAQANLARTQQEVKQAEATAAANTEKANAEAQSAEISAKTAQEQWDINHPKLDGTQNLTGPAYLHYLQQTDPGRAAYVQALSEGRVPFPGTQMMRTPAGQALLTQVMRADPTIDATNYTTRAAARTSAATGRLSQSDNALITAIGHAARLEGLIPDVAGHSFTPLNSVENFIGSITGGKQPAYDQNAELLGDEVAAAYGTKSQGKQDEAGAQFDSSMSTRQKNDNILGAIDLMASKLAANRAQFAYGNGQLAKPDFMLLPEQTRQELMSIPGAAPIVGKYFSGIPVMGHNGSGGPPPVGGAGTPPGGPPPVGPDYSGLTGPNGGAGAALAATDPNSKLGAFQQTYRSEFDPVMANTFSTFIRKGVPYATAAQFAQSHGFTPPDPNTYAQAVQFAAQHGGATNVSSNKMVPTTLGERLASSPLAAGIAGAASGATAGLSDVAGRSLAGPAWDANRAALAATNPGMDLAGNVAGGVGGMFGGDAALGNLLRVGAKGGLARNALALAMKNPMTAGVLGDTAYSTAYGASENPDNPLAGAETGAILGPLSSIGGQYLAKGTGAAIQGVTDPAVQRLRAAGIPLTVGEVLGGGAKKAQDALTSVFGPGNMVEARYADGRQALNQAAFNQAAAPIGANISATGQAGIQALNAAKSRAYENALNPISLDLNTPQTISDLQGAVNAARAIPNVDQASDLAQGALGNYIGNAAPNGTMTGTDFQQAYRGLARTARGASNRIYGHEIADALGQGQDALVGALQDQNPGAYQGFLNANAANRNLNVLANAVNAAKNQDGQLFTPAQLGTAATANAKSLTGNIAAASGQRPFNQLAIDAQKVMSSRLPDSGTATRALVTGDLLTSGGILAGLSGAGGMFGNQEGGTPGAVGGAIAPLGILTLLGTRRGQQLLTGALANRTLTDQYTGAMLRRNSQVGGDILTSAGIPLLTGP